MTFSDNNSQQPIYYEDVEYFVTIITEGRYPYFNDPIIAELFVRDLWFAVGQKQLAVFGYTVLPDHVHLMFEPKGELKFSEVLQSIRMNFLRDANDILIDRVGRFGVPAAGDGTSGRPLEYQQHYINDVEPLHERFHAAHGTNHKTPLFAWQESFRDHVTRDEIDFFKHLRYIFNNAVKHGLVIEAEDYPLMWITGMKNPFAPD